MENIKLKIEFTTKKRSMELRSNLKIKGFIVQD